jgi:hydrogenase-4 component B
MSLLALACVALGLCAPVVAPVIAKVAASLAGGSALAVADGSVVFPANASQTALSTPLIAVLLLALPLLPVILGALLKGERIGRRHGGDPWACGYAHDSRMVMSSASFAQPLRAMFGPLYQLRRTIDPSIPLTAAMQRIIGGATHVEPTWDERVVAPVMRLVQWLGHRIQRLQHGDFRIYCLYVVVALAILLLIAVA